MPTEITESEALEITKRHAELKSWSYLEPVRCRKIKADKIDVWKVETSYGMRGCNIILHISCLDGSIIKEAYLPR